MQVRLKPSRRCSGDCDTPCITVVHAALSVRRKAVTKRSLCFCVALCPEEKEGGIGVPFLLFKWPVLLIIYSIFFPAFFPVLPELGGDPFKRTPWSSTDNALLVGIQL